jgi:hypothetical protein
MNLGKKIDNWLKVIVLQDEERSTWKRKPPDKIKGRWLLIYRIKKTDIHKR